MAETKEEKPAAPEPQVNEDDARAAAATANRKRALADWEEKKKRWLAMGVPPALPAAGSTPKKKPSS
ncbi:MAG: hypothetical protein ABI610_05485 [Acidobacteriota bacterium]